MFVVISNQYNSKAINTSEIIAISFQDCTFYNLSEPCLEFMKRKGKSQKEYVNVVTVTGNFIL